MAGQAHRFDVEVARTDAEQDRGLMFRTSLPENGGMLFPFKKPRIGSFWMKNTLIPLDMIFIRADGSVDRLAENNIHESHEPVVRGGEVSEYGRASWRERWYQYVEISVVAVSL